VYGGRRHGADTHAILWGSLRARSGEGGFFPGIIVYLTHWFALKDRARAMSGLILAIPIALGLGAPLSAAILQIHWFNISGWRWLFILEGLPAVAIGVFTFFYLTDRPDHARWLEPDEREWIKNTLEAERLGKKASVHVTVFSGLPPAQRDPFCRWRCFSANLTVTPSSFGCLTVIKKASGLSVTAATLLSGLPYAAGLIAMVAVSYLSDRSGRRRFYTIMPLILTAVFLALSALPRQPSRWSWCGCAWRERASMPARPPSGYCPH